MWKIDSVRIKKVLRIHLGPDLLGSISPMKGVLCFTKTEIARTDIGNHHGVTSSPERVLEQLGELGVSVRDVFFALYEGIDAAAKCKE